MQTVTGLQRQAKPWPAMSCMPAGAICLASGAPLLAQPLYKVADADDNVTFTDTPPLSSDSTDKKHFVKAPNSPKPTQTTLDPAAPAEVEKPTLCDRRIVTPADNATIPMRPGNLAVQAAWNPFLASGETIRLSLDGEPVGAPQQTASWQLSNLYRGEHRLPVVCLYENGLQLDVSSASTVCVLRPTVNR